MLSIFRDDKLQTARLFFAAEKQDKKKEFECMNEKNICTKIAGNFGLKNKPCKCLLMTLVCFLLNDYESKEKCKKKKD